MPRHTNQLHNQNEEKEKRAAELAIANKELLFQNEEKEKRAAELAIANKELLFQNEEKEKRAAELILANQELLFQNEEKEKRAAELAIANKELLFQTAELAKAIERYRSTLDNMLEGCQIIGFDWHYLYLNAVAEKHNHRPNEELLGKKYMDMWAGIESTEVFVIIRRCMEERIAHQMENGFIFPDGTMGWFELSIQPVPEGIFILSQDITERKRAEETLRANEKRLQLAVTAGGVGIWDWDVVKDELVWDESMYFLYRIVQSDFGGAYDAWSKTLHPDDRQFTDREIQAALRGEREYRAEFRIMRSDGVVRFIKATSQTIFNQDGKAVRMIGTNIDITERKQAETEIIRRLQNIQALQRIDQAIAGSLDLKLTLNVVLEQTKTELNVDAAAVLLLNPHTQVLEFAAGIGFRSKAIERSRLRLGEGHGGRAALERRTVSVTNLLDAERSDQFVRAPLLADEGFVTYFSTPLIAKGQVSGVLEVFHRSPFIPNQDWLDFLEVLAGQTAIAVDSASLFTDLQHSNTELFNAYDSTIEGWSHALDLRDKETEGHTLRVTEMTIKLAHAAGITEAELVHVRRGALLHDIGKMGVPDAILLKPDKLTDEEWVAMRKHPTFAFELLSPIAYLRPALDIPYCHHEKWDGNGYPRGLKGEQIPMAARLFAIVDVWDALRSDRPYRQSWSKEKVIEHIKSLSGTHFEPKAVELFLNMMNEDEKNAG